MQHKHSDIFGELIRVTPDAKNSTDTLGNTYLHRAILYAFPRAVADSFSALNIDPNVPNHLQETPLLYLAQTDCDNFREIYDLLLSKGANPKLINQKKHNIFHVVAEDDNQQFTKMNFVEPTIGKEHFKDGIISSYVLRRSGSPRSASVFTYTKSTLITGGSRLFKKLKN